MPDLSYRQKHRSQQHLTGRVAVDCDPTRAMTKRFWGAVPLWVAGLHLVGREARVLIAITSFAGKQSNIERGPDGIIILTRAARVALETIADHTNLARRHVQTAIRGLEAKGILRPLRRAGYVTEYQIIFKRGADGTNGIDGGTGYGAPSDENGTDGSTGYGAPSDENGTDGSTGYGAPSDENGTDGSTGYGAPSDENGTDGSTGYGAPSDENGTDGSTGYGAPSDKNGIDGGTIFGPDGAPFSGLGGTEYGALTESADSRTEPLSSREESGAHAGGGFSQNPVEEKQSVPLPSNCARGRLEALKTFNPSGPLIDWAAELGINARADNVLGKFIDHHCAHGRVPADLEAAFRNWIRNEMRFAGGHDPGGSRVRAKRSDRSSLVESALNRARAC